MAGGRGTSTEPEDLHGASGADAAQPGPRRRTPLDRVAIAGTVLICAQFILFVVWTAFLYHHDDLTSDYAFRLQAWFEIAHGHLSAPVTASPLFTAFWHDHLELINWPLAPLIYLWPHAFWLNILECAGVCGSSLVAFRWVLAILRAPSWHSGPARSGWPRPSWIRAHRQAIESASGSARNLPEWWVATVALVIVVANPWSFGTVSFDVHFHASIGVLFALLTARSVFDERPKRTVLFAALTLLCGDVAGLYLVAIGVSTVLMRRRQWRTGAVLVAVGVAWFVFVNAVGGSAGTRVGLLYGSLAGVSPRAGLGTLVVHLVLHPGGVLRQVVSKQINSWAYLSASGILGFVSGWGFPMAALTLVSNEAARGLTNTSTPMQNYALVGFMLVGTVLVLGSCARWWLANPSRPRWPLYAVTLVLIANSIGWAVTWIPKEISTKTLVSGTTAVQLAADARRIPSDAELVMLQGDGGPFGARQKLYLIGRGSTGTSPVPFVANEPVYWLITPYQGLESVTTDVELGTLSRLVTLGARLLSDAHGVWLFRWVPTHTGSIRVTHATRVPGWALATQVGHPVVSGNASSWSMSTDGKAGYAVDGAYWYEVAGSYQASVKLACSGPCSVQVWDDTTNQLIGQRNLTPTDGIVTIPIDFRLAHVSGTNNIQGAASFVFLNAPPPSGDDLEVRVYEPAHSLVSVYNAGLAPISG